MLADALRLIMRIVHTGALAVWLGGGLIYLLSNPNLRYAVAKDVWASHERVVRTLMSRCFALLIASGAYLVFDRLADPRLGMTYITVLGLKLALVAAIWWTITNRRPRRAALSCSRMPAAAWIAIALGAGATVLGVLLTVIYEAQLVGP